MSELKPCPFCGGEAKLVIGTLRDGGYIENCAFVRCERCGARSYEFHECVTPDEVQGYASEAWNRRDERTCRMVDCGSRDTCVVNRELVSGNIVSMEFGYKQCSECGANVFDCPTVRYCPSCGAKVVE